MRRLFSIIYFFLFTSTLIIGQKHFLITGIITDTATGKPLPHATVTLKSADTIVETRADSLGKYSFGDANIKPDKIYVLYAHTDGLICGNVMGRESFVSTYGLKGNPRKYLRNIQLVQNAVSEPPAPMARVYFNIKENKVVNPTKDSALNVWLQYLLYNPTYVVEVAGHADDEDGSKTIRMMTSNARAQECIEYLHQYGIPYAQMRLAGYGDAAPAMSNQEIRKIKDKNAQMAARKMNCYAEIRLVNIFYKPIPAFTVNGIVTDINTGLPIRSALMQFYGNDDTKLTTETDSTGSYSITVAGFNPLVSYFLSAEAIGYDMTDSDAMFKTGLKNFDEAIYTKNFSISRHGFETQPIFTPIEFDSGSIVLRKDARDTLNSLKNFMDSRPELVMEFMGDADWREPDFVNLASARARVCINYLVAMGINNARFVVSNRLNGKGVEKGATDTPVIVSQKEKKTRFNHRACSVTFWPINWKFSKGPSQ